jgi:hypothetical protein
MFFIKDIVDTEESKQDARGQLKAPIDAAVTIGLE